MPILITLSTAMDTTAMLPISKIYAIIESVSYSRRGLIPKTLQFEVGYYSSEAASISVVASRLEINGLPTNISQPVTPEQANTLPLFDFLEGLLKTQLTTLLPAGTLLDKVA